MIEKLLPDIEEDIFANWNRFILQQNQFYNGHTWPNDTALPNSLFIEQTTKLKLHFQ